MGDEERVKSLVIVGNAEVDKDYSGFIDSCDCVVRFNDCRHYGNKVGTRSDILYVTNAGAIKNTVVESFLAKRTKEQVRSELPYLDDDTQVCFPRPDAEAYIRFLSDELPFFNLRRIHLLRAIKRNRDLDVASALTQSLHVPEANASSCDAQFHLHVWRKLLTFGTTRAIDPSTGILGIEALLNDKKFSGYQKYIVGFSWQGSFFHPWELEQRLVQSYIDKGILKPLSCHL